MFSSSISMALFPQSAETSPKKQCWRVSLLYFGLQELVLVAPRMRLDGFEVKSNSGRGRDGKYV